MRTIGNGSRLRRMYSLEIAGTIALIGCLVFVVSASSLSAKNKRSDRTPEERLETTMTELKELLSLSDEQSTQISAYYQEYYEKMQALREQGWRRSKINREKSREEREAIRGELEAKLETVLTAEQMETYHKYQEEQRAMRWKRRGDRGGKEKGEGSSD